MANAAPIQVDDPDDQAFRQAVAEGLASLNAGRRIPYEDGRR